MILQTFGGVFAFFVLFVMRRWKDTHTQTEGQIKSDSQVRRKGMSKLGIRFDERRVISLCWSRSNPLVGRRGIHSSTDSTRRSSCCSSASPAEGIRPLTSGELDSFFEELRQQQQQQHSSSGSWRPLSDPILTTSSFFFFFVVRFGFERDHVSAVFFNNIITCGRNGVVEIGKRGKVNPNGRGVHSVWICSELQTQQQQQKQAQGASRGIVAFQQHGKFASEAPPVSFCVVVDEPSGSTLCQRSGY